MWPKARNFFERHRGEIMGGFLLVIIVLWISQPFQDVLPFEAAMALTTSAILMFSILALDYLVGIGIPRGVEIYKNEQGAKARLEAYIRDARPSNVRLIEYSTASIEYLLESLNETPVSIELLISNPHAAITDYQRKRRICSQITRLRAIFSNPSNLKIKCYSQNASLRGRNFDNRLVAVGWYTYDVREQLVGTYGDKQIWGDTNTIVIVPSEARGMSSVVEMFNRVFNSLWDRAEPLQEVCGNCHDREKCRPDDQWLQLTNPENARGMDR